MTIKILNTANLSGIYAKDVPALAAAIANANADAIIVPGTSAVRRAIGAAALRAGAEVDTNITSVKTSGGKIVAERWFYRQRILAAFTRTAKTWVLVTDPALTGEIAGALETAGEVAVPVPDAPTATAQEGIVAAGAGGESTIKPDAKLLFVAGAGWTKKQADGATHLDEAAAAIKGFLAKSGASLGSSKSLVDMPEAAAKFDFMSHVNQVGQTGSTPRHAKGLSTCCHGEEPHVVGWRFVGERRAVNLDANCGWAQGKADVVYVGDAFEVMKKVNELL
ncbi:MAG: electron transfer flavoprotein subunit alpha [Kiritimatiellae bacterium]|nr:electron transfer flavoprotein subunit alpha [Kiritimatiellia bacterium]